MHYSKQHKILEEIFDFVKSQGRKDLIDAYNEASKMRVVSKICSARKKWECAKCSASIEIGEKHYREEYVQRNSSGALVTTKRICLKCHDIPKKIEKRQSKLRFIKENL